jgi:hypothetical protein
MLLRHFCYRLQLPGDIAVANTKEAYGKVELPKEVEGFANQARSFMGRMYKNLTNPDSETPPVAGQSLAESAPEKAVTAAGQASSAAVVGTERASGDVAEQTQAAVGRASGAPESAADSRQGFLERLRSAGGSDPSGDTSEPPSAITELPKDAVTSTQPSKSGIFDALKQSKNAQSSSAKTDPISVQGGVEAPRVGEQAHKGSFDRIASDVNVPEEGAASGAKGAQKGFFDHFRGGDSDVQLPEIGGDGPEASRQGFLDRLKSATGGERGLDVTSVDRLKDAATGGSAESGLPSAPMDRLNGNGSAALEKAPGKGLFEGLFESSGAEKGRLRGKTDGDGVDGAIKGTDGAIDGDTNPAKGFLDSLLGRKDPKVSDVGADFNGLDLGQMDAGGGTAEADKGSVKGFFDALHGKKSDGAAEGAPATRAAEKGSEQGLLDGRNSSTVSGADQSTAKEYFEADGDGFGEQVGDLMPGGARKAPHQGLLDRFKGDEDGTGFFDRLRAKGSSASGGDGLPSGSKADNGDLKALVDTLKPDSAAQGGGGDGGGGRGPKALLDLLDPEKAGQSAADQAIGDAGTAMKSTAPSLDSVRGATARKGAEAAQKAAESLNIGPGGEGSRLGAVKRAANGAARIDGSKSADDAQKAVEVVTGQDSSKYADAAQKVVREVNGQDTSKAADTAKKVAEAVAGQDANKPVEAAQQAIEATKAPNADSPAEFLQKAFDAVKGSDFEKGSNAMQKVADAMKATTDAERSASKAVEAATGLNIGKPAGAAQKVAGAAPAPDANRDEEIAKNAIESMRGSMTEGGGPADGARKAAEGLRDMDSRKILESAQSAVEASKGPDLGTASQAARGASEGVQGSSPAKAADAVQKLAESLKPADAEKAVEAAQKAGDSLKVMDTGKPLEAVKKAAENLKVPDVGKVPNVGKPSNVLQGAIEQTGGTDGSVVTDGVQTAADAMKGIDPSKPVGAAQTAAESLAGYMDNAAPMSTEAAKSSANAIGEAGKMARGSAGEASGALEAAKGNLNPPGADGPTINFGQLPRPPVPEAVGRVATKGGQDALESAAATMPSRPPLPEVIDQIRTNTEALVAGAKTELHSNADRVVKTLTFKLPEAPPMPQVPPELTQKVTRVCFVPACFFWWRGPECLEVSHAFSDTRLILYSQVFQVP